MKKSTGSAILAVMAVGVAGAAAFLFTRPAAAKNLAKQAFNVDLNCAFFLVTDEEKAKSAIIAAAITVAPTPDSNALEALKAILTVLFPECDWQNPPDSRTFAMGENHINWSTIKLLVGTKTVAELKTLLDAGGGLQGSAPMPWLVPMVFGTGGCLSCAMGTGGETRSKQGYMTASDRKKGTGARGPRMNLTLGVGGSGYLPPKIPKGWLPVKSRSYDPKARGFRRWIEPLDAPTPQNNVVRAILVMKSGNVEHNVHAELINVGGNKWKGRVTAGPF